MRGGKRPGAGRKPGSKNRLLAAAKDRLRRVLVEHESGIIKRLLACDDPKVLLETWRLCLVYVDGRPAERLAVEHSVNVEQILQTLAERRLRAAAERPKLLPSGDEEREA